MVQSLGFEYMASGDGHSGTQSPSGDGNVHIINEVWTSVDGRGVTLALIGNSVLVKATVAVLESSDVPSTVLSTTVMPLNVKTSNVVPSTVGLFSVVLFSPVMVTVTSVSVTKGKVVVCTPVQL